MTAQDEMICPSCYSTNPAASAFCSRCGGKLNIEPAPSPFIEKQKPVVPHISIIRILGLAAFLLIGVWIIHWIANGGLYKSNVSESDTSVESPKPGTERLLNAREREFVYIGTSQEAIMDFVKAAQAKDEVGLRQLLFSRRLFTVQKNTRALILENDYPFLRVRILEGPHITEAGWIDPTWVK
ncbi:MAG: zinc ribbon domain-containing protein [Blastocatellia bacterium]